MDRISLCRVCLDALGRSAELGLVSPEVSGIGRVCEQHLAAHLGGAAGRGRQASGHEQSAGNFQIGAERVVPLEERFGANPDIKVLLSIDPASFPLGTGPKPNEIWHSGDYPVAWTNKKYKMIYVNMGHNDMDYENKTNKELSFTFDNETQNQFIVDGLLWLGGGKKDDAAGSTRPSSSAQPQP